MDMETRPRVVIIGGGFAGIAAAKQLKDADVEVLLLDRTNHHLFQPLLYQVATAALSPTEIVAPIRAILRHQRNTTVLMTEVVGIDAAAKTLQTADQTTIGFDYLILACGARHSYFGKDEWEKDAPGLKTLADALEIRRRFLSAFEEAEKTEDLALREALLTFVIVGGGPTGCELAGVMPEIAKNALKPDFRRIDAGQARIILIENSPTILNVYPDDLAKRAQLGLTQLGVEIRNGVKVTEVRPDGVTLSDGTQINSRTVIWAAGNKASPLGALLGVPMDRAGRVIVEKDLSVPGFPNIFVVGDMAAAGLIQKDGTPIPEKTVPGIAPAATQGGLCAATNILARIAAKPTQPFVYFDKGSLATLGRNQAVGLIFGQKVHGFLGWFLWAFVHLMVLVGFRNRAAVLLNWAYAYWTYQRGARLISPRSHR
jgi:NADH:ubiquinone reductase (H+-translocating)